jgi:phosphomannomutase/phosphoglucomutase
MSRSDKTLSQSLADLPKTYSTPEIRVYASDQVKFKIVDEVKKELANKYPIIDIDGVRAIYPNGWALVRPSNTQAILVLRFEADSEKALQAIRSEVEKIIEDVITRLETE